MALRDYYRCKKCDAKVVYGPDRSDEDWEPFLLCRECIATITRQRDALRSALMAFMNLPHLDDDVCERGARCKVCGTIELARAALAPEQQEEAQRG